MTIVLAVVNDAPAAPRVAGRGRGFVPCPDGCEARRNGNSEEGPPRAAPPCPIREAQGRWGWPCTPSCATWADQLEE